MKTRMTRFGSSKWSFCWLGVLLGTVLACSAHALERLEPPEGCYFGVGIGFDSGEWDPIDTVDWWSERMGGLVAGAYEYFTDYPVVGQDLDKIERFMQQVIPYHGIAIVTLRPFGGLSITNCSQEAAAAFGDLCARWESEGVGGIMVRFGNEMNAGWFPWGQQPTAYRNAYRMLASNVHERTERTAMVWDPNEGAGFPWPVGEYVRIDKDLYREEYEEMDTNNDGGLSGQDDMYAPFYPGDDAVDWVGMSSYHWGMEWPWGENEEPHTDKLVAQIRGLDQKDVRNFYDKYCRDGVHNKPLMISETAALFNADRTDGDSEYDVKSKWWEQLYNAFGDNTNCFDVAEHLPKLKMICWFDRICHETEINHDRIVWGFSTPSDIETGWVATNHTWLEDFEHLDSWWQPWDVTWTASDTVFCEGSNSLMLRGLSVAESNKYVGGCGRSIGDSFFDAKKTIAQFEGLHVNGWDGQPRATVDDFEIPAAWSAGPWIDWTLTGDAKSGTNAVCMSGVTQTSSNDYVGGNLRFIQTSVFVHDKTLAEMQDLTAAPTNVVYTDLVSVEPFESEANWPYPWNITMTTTSDCIQGDRAVVLTQLGALQDNGWYVGGGQRTYSGNWSAKNGLVLWVKRGSGELTNPKLKIELVDSGGVAAGVEREIPNTSYQALAFTFDDFATSGAFNWSAIAFLKVHLLPSIQGSNPAPIYLDNWNIANVTKHYPDEVDWNNSWELQVRSVSDPADGLLPNSMWLSRTNDTESTNKHIGGVRGTLRNDCRDWSSVEALRVTVRRGTNRVDAPSFGMQLKDAEGRYAHMGDTVNHTEYGVLVITRSQMSITNGFDWSAVEDVQINMNTGVIGVTPADLYVKKIELGTMMDASTISDWSDYDGVEIWAKRETSTEPDPVLMLEVVSGTCTANAARTVSSRGVYEPLRIYYDDFRIDSGFNWGNVTELRVGMLSTTNGVQPGDLSIDAWSVVATEKTLYDQDWWTPWVDTNDPTGTNEFEFKLESDPVIGGTNVLTMSGLDQDNETNSAYGYIGGSGFSVRAFECDWSDYTHFKITARRDSEGEANPVIQVTITDQNGKTAHIGRTVKNTGYLRQCCSFADMDPEAGFDWGAIEDVKFELLTDEAHATPGKLYIQDFVLGVMPNVSPRDWTPFNGMELKIRRANETNTHPLLRVTVESEVGSITNTAYSFIAVRHTNEAFKAMRIPLVEMHQSVRPFPWDNISSVKVELFTEEEGVIPDTVYLDDWRLVNLSVNPDDEVRNGMIDYVRQLRDGKRYFLFQQDEAFQRMVSPYAAWTRELGAILPTNGDFQVRLPVKAEEAADVVVELYDGVDQKLGEGRTTVDAGLNYATVTVSQTNALPDRTGGYYYKTYVTSVGGSTAEALAVTEDATVFVRDIKPSVKMVALPKILRPGDRKNIIVRYASAQAGWLVVNLVDATGAVRGSGRVFVQGGASDEWVYLVVDGEAPQTAGYYLHAFLSGTEDGSTPVSEVDYVSVAMKQYMDHNRLFYIPPQEITPNQTLRMPIGYTIVSNKFNVLMELVDASDNVLASEEDFAYDGNGVLELMLKPGNYPVGDYGLRVSMRDDIWDLVPVGTNQVVETNELGVVIGTNDVVEYEYQFIRYDYHLSKTSEVKVVEQGYADWVNEQWVCPVFSDATGMSDDANRDRVSNYEDYLAGLDPLRPVDIHYAFKGIHEPLRGVYLAAFINGNSDTLEEIEEFTEKAGKSVAVYGRFVDLYENCYPAEWMERIHYNYPGAGVHLVLEPWMAFTNFYGANWAPGQSTYEQAKAFVDGCAGSGLPVFLRFAHEANGWWYPWCPGSLATDVTAEQYKEGWRNFAQMVHERAPNVAMVWAPNQGSCDRMNPQNIDPDALNDYLRVYPGDDVVDWVGMSVYNGSWYGNGDQVQDDQLSRAIHKGYSEDTYQDFYWTFSDPDNPDGHKKPMMIAETSFQYVPRYSLSNVVDFARFESMDGPEILSISNTPYEGMETALTNYWSWNIWDCIELSTTSLCTEGAAALVLHPTGAKDGGIYVGGFGRDVSTNAPDFRDWTPYNGIRITLRREAGGEINPTLRMEIKDISGNAASYQQVVSWTEYQDVQLYLDRFDYPDGFDWATVVGFSFHIFTPEAGVVPADVYMDDMELSVVEMLTDQEWVASWDLETWEQTAISVTGKALRMGGVVTNGGNYVGGCLAVISRPDRTGWEESDALVFYVRRETGLWGARPDPKLKIVLDADWDDNNGTEASVEFKISNADYARMVIPFEDFQTGEEFEWGRVNKMIFHMMTSDGPNPYDLFIDEVSRVTAVVTNVQDDLSIKADWMDQLFGLQDNHSVSPYYSDVSRKFRNIHMVNWFHIRKIEDGEMRDFRLPECEGATPLYRSYYERVQSSYFLTNVVTDRSGDGIPDDWAEEYFGDITNAVGEVDSDGDGFSNWQEYIAGTHPLSAESFLFSTASLDRSAGPDGEYAITWPSQADRVYSIAFTTNLYCPMTLVATNIPADPPTNRYIGDREGYYRIMVSP